MKIYTRTGDGGKTALFGGGRVSKASARVEAYGQVDELNASLGVALAALPKGESFERLRRVQHDLFAVGASLATPPPAPGRKAPTIPDLPLHRIEQMEGWIDAAEAESGALTTFILPGGPTGAAALHLSRTVCRRAERAVVMLAAHEPVEDGVLRYLNRLSDLLFALARLEGVRAGGGDIPWEKDG